MQVEGLQRIAIHSVPRSGSTWLGSIFDSAPNVAFRFQPLFSYGHKDRLDEKSTKKEISAFFQEIFFSNDAFVAQSDSKKEKLVPSFPKDFPTHVVYKEVRYHHVLNNLLQQDKDIRFIGLIRNPMAVIHSWLNAPKEFRRDLGWLALDEWKFAPRKNIGRPEEFNGYVKWKEAVLIFESLKDSYPERVRLIKYKDLIDNTFEAVQALFDFCELSMNKQTLAFIEESRKAGNINHPYSVYNAKEEDNQWRSGLPELIQQEILRDIQGSVYEKYC